MDKAQLYAKSNELQKRDAKHFLKKFIPKMSWEDAGETILDVGCGSGDVTKTVLLPLLPTKSIEKIVGADVSKEMVDFARKDFDHNLIEYRQLNIENDTKEHLQWNQTFSKIMSFYCLHWIRDYETSLGNMFELLKENGEVFLVFLASNPIFTMYENLSSKDRWHQYMTDVSKFIPVFQYKENPSVEFKKIAQEAGFDVYYCEAVEQIFHYKNINYLKDALKAVNPFVNRMPTNLKDDFLNDCLQKLVSICPSNENGGTIANYKLMVAHLKKPSNVM